MMARNEPNSTYLQHSNVNNVPPRPHHPLTPWRSTRVASHKTLLSTPQCAYTITPHASHTCCPHAYCDCSYSSRSNSRNTLISFLNYTIDQINHDTKNKSYTNTISSHTQKTKMLIMFSRNQRQRRRPRHQPQRQPHQRQRQCLKTVTNVALVDWSKAASIGESCVETFPLLFSIK